MAAPLGSPVAGAGFAADQLRSSLACIDAAFHISPSAPDSQALSILFSPSRPRAAASASTTTTTTAPSASSERQAQVQSLWDAIHSPVFASLALPPAQRRSLAVTPGIARLLRLLASASPVQLNRSRSSTASASHGTAPSSATTTTTPTASKLSKAASKKHRRKSAARLSAAEHQAAGDDRLAATLDTGFMSSSSSSSSGTDTPSGSSAAHHAAATQAVDHELAHLVLLAKSLAAIRALAIQELLDDVPPLAREIAYWERVQASRPSSLLYLIQTLPVRLARGVWAVLAALFGWTGLVPRLAPSRSASSEALDGAGVSVSQQQMHHQGSLAHLGLGLALRLRPRSWLDVMRAEMACKRERLVQARLWQAQCLGLLARSNAESVFQPVQALRDNAPNASAAAPASAATLDPISPLAVAAAHRSAQSTPSQGSQAAALGGSGLANIKEASRKLARLFKPKPRQTAAAAAKHGHSSANVHDSAGMQSSALGVSDGGSSSSASSALVSEVRDLLRSHVAAEIASIGAVVASLSGLARDLPTAEEGQLLAIEPQTVSHALPVGALYVKVNDLAHSLETVSRQSQTVVSLYGRPSLLLRAWFPTLVTMASISIAARYSSVSQATALLQSTSQQVLETLTGFATNWVLRPLHNVLQTIRHDETRLALLGTESLASDLGSLERMVTDFARDHGTTSASALADIASSVRQGDLTVVLQRYEADIKTPLASAVSGDLIRSLLIQIQKAKVDGELAMSALDKLLRSNELNFAFLAVMPTLAVAYVGGGYMARLWAPRRASYAQTIGSMRKRLRDIERILNRMDLGYSDAAELSIYDLRQVVSVLPLSLVDRPRLDEDVRDLEAVAVYSSNKISAAGIAVLDRMWRTHAVLQRF
ncbi:ATP synthase regulation protein NCA2-domain-containing protein [Entophlyctis helioformis]|nr:ATP synthase regulation protein NCA2-domain-containing protein [Entophlyctis helioformis]